MTPLWQAHGWCPLRRLPALGRAEAAPAGLSAASLSCALQEAGRCLPFTVLGAGRPRFPPSSPSSDGPGPEASLQAVGTAAPQAWPRPRAPWLRAPLQAGVSAGGHLVLSSVPRVQPWGHRRFGQARGTLSTDHPWKSTSV